MTIIMLRSSSKKVNKDLGLSTNWKITFTGESNLYMLLYNITALCLLYIIIDCIYFLKIAYRKIKQPPKKFVWLGYNWQMVYHLYL